MLKIIIHYSNWNDSFQLACICAAIVAFFAFLRKSNITVKPNDAWDAHSIARKNVTRNAANNTMWITLLTKTRGHTSVDPLCIPMPRMHGNRLDPWTWWSRHLMLSPSASLDVHAFAYNDGTAAAATRPLLHADFRRFIKSKLRLGCPTLDIDKYSHHSFRRGGATFAFANNVPELFIQAMGDWLSDSYKRYIELDQSIRVNVAQRFASAITGG